MGMVRDIGEQVREDTPRVTVFVKSRSLMMRTLHDSDDQLLGVNVAGFR